LRTRSDRGTEPLEEHQRWQDDKSAPEFIHSGLDKNNALGGLQSS
jgi:hypothetical protein